MDFKVLVILMMMIVCSASLATFVAPTHSHPEDGFYDDHMASGLNSVSEDFVLNGRNLLEEGHRIPLWMDVQALLSFKKDIKDPSGKLSNWTIENWEEACSWYGVNCTHHNPRVVAIILPRLNLTGTISPSIGGLSLLYTLNLSSNYLTGEIPPEIGQLKALRILDLTVFDRPDAYLYDPDSHLLLSGSIPKSLSNCTSLQYIGFAGNNFTGTIPTEFGRLVHLKQLDLGYNKFTGTIPTEFGRLVHLEQLDLGFNSLGGRIPHTLSNCSKLSTLSLSNNNFTGTIPREFGRLIHLSYLNLEHNSLGGHLPPTLGNCTKLQYISLHENRLFGRIPSSFFCHSLKKLDLSENSLSGDLNIRFPVSMIVFKVGSNNFFGPLPPSLANCSNLQILDLWKNRFGGVLPSFLANYNQLQVLNLRKNRFTGKLPDYITSFHNLQILGIGYNKFHGCIGEWITNLTKLYILDLSNNEFTGKIPSGPLKLQGFAIDESRMFKRLYYERLYYEMEIVMKGFEYLLSYVLPTYTILDLSNNNFTGEIPANIGSLSSLRLLNLSWNQLEGKIPASLGTIHTLEQLDLSENNLSGGIPQNLSTLTMLAIMDVSSNNLCGPIPLGIQMSTFDVTSFRRNKCLCGFPLSACKKNKIKLVEGVSGKRNVTEWLCSVDEKISLIALGIGMVIGFGGVLLVFLACKTTRDWVVPPHKPKSFYGEYRLPT